MRTGTWHVVFLFLINAGFLHLDKGAMVDMTTCTIAPGEVDGYDRSHHRFQPGSALELESYEYHLEV